MASKKWIAVCQCCGKAGTGLVLADQVMHHQVFLALVRVVRMASISQNGKKNN